MGSMSLPAELRSTETRRSQTDTAARVLVQRLVLLLAVSATAAAVAALTLAPLPRVEPDLLRLLRGMVLIKGLIALAAGALVWWRLGQPIGRGRAAAYIGALCLSFGALAWLWGLHLMLAGSVFFYAGLAGLLLAGRGDPLIPVLSRKAHRP